MGERRLQIVDEPSMGDDDFEIIEDRASEGDNTKLVGLLAGSMDRGSLGYVESVAWSGAGGRG